MNVKELKDLLDKIENPERVLILCPGHDHTLYPVSPDIRSVLKESTHSYTIDYGEEITPEKEYGKRMSALVFSQ